MAVPRPLFVLVLALVSLFVSAAAPSAARADAGDGVHVDPDSAPAAEYALPLDAARRAALGPAGEGDGASGASGGVAPAPAFGSGITPKDAEGAAGRSRGRDRATTRSGGGASATRREQAQPRDDASSTSIADAGGDPALYSLGGAVAVLVAGGLLALTLRRRQSTA